MKVDIVNLDAKNVGSIELSDAVFGAEVRNDIMQRCVEWQRAKRRAGTHATKTITEVSGTTAKPYNQKGTGRARQGSTRAPQFAGGGTVHGPTPRSYDQRTPKKMKAAALRGALSDRAREGRIHVVTGLVEGDEPSTKRAESLLLETTERPNLLVVVERDDVASWLSVRNLPNVRVVAPDQLNTYDVLVTDDVIFTKEAFDTFVSGPAKGRSAKAVATESEVSA